MAHTLEAVDQVSSQKSGPSIVHFFFLLVSLQAFNIPAKETTPV